MEGEIAGADAGGQVEAAPDRPDVTAAVDGVDESDEVVTRAIGVAARLEFLRRFDLMHGLARQPRHHAAGLHRLPNRLVAVAWS
jgi:hypothetical protein